MDPLSITASVIAVLQFANTVSGYLNSIRNASREQQRVAVEVGYLIGAMTSLRFRLEGAQSDDAWFCQLKALRDTKGPLSQMQETLQELADNLVPSDSKRGYLKRTLLWQWSKQEVHELLKKVQYLKTLVDLALASDHFALSEATYRQVKATQTGIKALDEGMSRLDFRTEKLEANLDQELQNKLSNWLAIPDPSVNYLAASKQRHGNSGAWLFSNTEFKGWKDSTTSILWLHGKAGCGKTVLSSTLLTTLVEDRSSSKPVAYFYFDFRDTDKQSVGKALRSLALQIASQSNNISRLEDLYVQCNQGSRQPSDNALKKCIESSINLDNPAYIILDALDECMDHESLLQLLEEFHTFQGLRLAVTSRRVRSLEHGLAHIVEYSISLESSVVDTDITSYVRDRIKTDSKLAKWSSAVRTEIATSLSEKADGMFRWVFCQLEALRKCLSLAALRKSLAALPSTLDETYDRIMHDIDINGHLEDAILILQWLVFSRRPLVLAELVEVLAIRPENDWTYDPDNLLVDPEDIMAICPGLLHLFSAEEEATSYDTFLLERLEMENISSKNTTKLVRLDHFSVQEYLLSSRCSFREHFDAQLCHVMLAKSCLQYLLHTCASGPMTRQRLKRFPLAKYAADGWWQHLLFVSHRPHDALNLATSLLNDPAGILSLTRLSFFNTYWINWRLTEADVKNSLVFAASTGIKELVLQYIEVSPPSEDTLGEALIQAAGRSHVDIVRMLLDAGADTEWTNDDHRGYTALIEALMSHSEGDNFEQIAHILLDAGANACPKNKYDMYPLSIAAERGYDSVCYRILDMELDVPTRMDLLMRSASLEVFQRVLNTGIDINRTDFWIMPIQWATYRSRTDLVQILIEKGADVNARGGSTLMDALMLAINNGHDKLVNVLLKAGAQHEGRHLARAVEMGNAPSIAALIEAGVGIHEANDKHTSLLELACLHKHKAALRILLDNGAIVSQHTEHYGAAFQAVCQFPSTSFEIISRITPDFEVLPGGNTCNQFALRIVTPEVCLELVLDFQDTEGKAGTIEIYQDHDVNSQELLAALSSSEDVSYDSMLLSDDELLEFEKSLELVLSRFKQPFEVIIMSLVRLAGSQDKYEIAIEDQEATYQTLLDLGAESRQGVLKVNTSSKTSELHIELAEMLLAAGAQIDAQGGVYGCALQAAARVGHIDLVRILLSRGADVNSTNGLFGTALEAAAASFQENLPLIRLLIHGGAEINAQSGEYGCALAAACYRGHTEIVEVLLKAGADVNLRGGRYETALQAACISPRATARLVQLLLDAGADRNIQGGRFGSATRALLCRGVRACVHIPRGYLADLESYEKQAENEATSSFTIWTDGGSLSYVMP